MNIIICDDSQNDRKILIELLQSYAQEKKQCFEMIEYDSGASLCEDESALQKCQLVFLDINMEDMDGLKAAMKIKNFEKNPANGGIPASENSEIVIRKAIFGFVL